MSVVGPRPHMLQEDQEIRTKVPKYRIRQFINPGIAGLPRWIVLLLLMKDHFSIRIVDKIVIQWGLAAVYGYRGGTKDLKLMKKRVEHDIYESYYP